jgi:hypothetical protein
MAAGSTLVAAPPQTPTTPAAAIDLQYVRSFTVETRYHHEWRADKPEVKSGVILVISVDPALVYPRQGYEPVLYVGDQTAQRLNVGYPSGQVIAIVPGDVDLKKAPIWFGSPELPERLTAEMIKTQREAAEKTGIKPFDAKKVNEAIKRGDEPLKVADRGYLHAEAALLIYEYAPDEKDRADGYRAPRVDTGDKGQGKNDDGKGETPKPNPPKGDSKS